MAAVAAGTGGFGTSLSELFQSSRRLLLKIRDGLERLERFEYASFSSSINQASSSSSPQPSEDSLKQDISQVLSLCFDMDGLWGSIHAKSQRDLWKRKVEQIAEEAYSYKDSLDKYTLRNQRRLQEAKERAELIGQANGESSHVLRIFDEEHQATQSVKNLGSWKKLLQLGWLSFQSTVSKGIT